MVFYIEITFEYFINVYYLSENLSWKNSLLLVVLLAVSLNAFAEGQSFDEAAADTYVTEELAVEAEGTAEEQEVDEKTTEEEAQSDK